MTLPTDRITPEPDRTAPKAAGIRRGLVRTPREPDRIAPNLARIARPSGSTPRSGAGITLPRDRITLEPARLTPKLAGITTPSGRITRPAGNITILPARITEPRGGITRTAAGITTTVARITGPSGRITRESARTTTPEDRITRSAVGITTAGGRITLEPARNTTEPDFLGRAPDFQRRMRWGVMRSWDLVMQQCDFLSEFVGGTTPASDFVVPDRGTVVVASVFVMRERKRKRPTRAVVMQKPAGGARSEPVVMPGSSTAMWESAAGMPGPARKGPAMRAVERTPGLARRAASAVRAEGALRV